MNPLYRNHLESLVKQINPNDPAELADLAAAFSSPGRFVWKFYFIMMDFFISPFVFCILCTNLFQLIFSFFPFPFNDRDELQEVIEELDVQKRLTLAVSLLKKELEVNRFQMQIQKQLDVRSLPLSLILSFKLTNNSFI